MTTPFDDRTPTTPSDRAASLATAGAMLAAFGALTILLVALTVVSPALLVGLLVLAAAGVQLLQAAQTRELWPRVWHGALGAIYLIGAVLLFFRVAQERPGLWLALAGFFLLDGAVRLTLGYRRLATRVSLWLIASGVTSVAISLLIYFGLPATASGRGIGLLVGIGLFGAGGFFMWLARSAAPMAEPRLETNPPKPAEPNGHERKPPDSASDQYFH